MALIDKLRFHNILTGAGLPEAPSIEFTDALQDTFDDQVSPLATKDDLERLWGRMERAMLALETRMTRVVLTVTGINIAAIATGVGIVLGFN